MRYLIFDNEQEAIAKEAEISAALGYPNEETNTDRYCVVTRHATLDQWSLSIGKAYSHPENKRVEVRNMLKAEERAALKSEVWVKDNGWLAQTDDAWLIRQRWKNKKGELVWSLKDGKLVHSP